MKTKSQSIGRFQKTRYELQFSQLHRLFALGYIRWQVSDLSRQHKSPITQTNNKPMIVRKVLNNILSSRLIPLLLTFRVLPKAGIFSTELQ